MTPSFRSYVANDAFKHFIAVVWIGGNVLLFYFTFMYYYNGPQFYYLHQMLGYGLCISRASASCISMNSSLLLFPMCKKLISYIRGFAPVVKRQSRRVLDRGRSFHIYCGYLLCLLAVIHFGAHMYNAIHFSRQYNFKYKELNVAKYADQNPIIVLVTTLPGITGLLLVLSLIFIAVFSSKSIRQKKHFCFWITHHMFIVYYILLFLHAMDGVLKYQVNIHEHVPGCVMILPENISASQNDPIIFPEPHAEPFEVVEIKSNDDDEVDFNLAKNHHKSTKKSSDTFMEYIRPEPEPILHPEIMLRNSQNNLKTISTRADLSLLKINGTLTTVMPCKQPAPKFESCPKEVWRWLCIPLTLYFFERLFRIYKSSNEAVTIQGFRLHSDDILELKLLKPDFYAKPGQTIFLRCPALSKVEQHPFSLTSVPSKQDPTFGIHIKILGDWTEQLREVLLKEAFEKKLQIPKLSEFDETNPPEDSWTFSPLYTFFNSRSDDLAAQYQHQCFDQCSVITLKNCSGSSSTSKSTAFNFDGSIKFSVRDQECQDKIKSTFVQVNNNNIRLFIDGPLVSAMEDVHKYRVSLCVAGGIGITPFASVINAILYNNCVIKKTKLKRIYLIWICKSFNSFQWFLDILDKLHIKLSKNNLPDFLNVRLYLTNIKRDASSDPSISSHSLLQRCTLTYSRPDMNEVLEDISNRHQKCTVGVFGCGPKSLLSAIEKSCRRPTCNCTTFVFNKESF